MRIEIRVTAITAKTYGDSDVREKISNFIRGKRGDRAQAIMKDFCRSAPTTQCGRLWRQDPLRKRSRLPMDGNDIHRTWIYGCYSSLRMICTALDDITMKDEDGKSGSLLVLRCLTLSWQQDYRIKGFRHQNLGLTRRRRSRRFQPALSVLLAVAGGLRRDRSSNFEGQY